MSRHGRSRFPWCDDTATRLSDVGTGRATRLIPTGIIEALSQAGLAVSSYPGQLRVLAPIFAEAIAQNRADLLEMALGQAAQTAPKGATCAIVTKLFNDLKDCWSE